LNFSADVAMKELEKAEALKNGKEVEKKTRDRGVVWIAASVTIALALGIGIFFFLPLAISNYLGIDKNALGFNLAAGAVRVCFFVAYVWGISFFSDFKRIFQYHGAEHKTIFAHENGAELTPESTRRFSRFHPRCGTSFILIVALFAIIVYAISDTLYAVYAGHAPGLATRFALHFSLLPLVAGGSYEILKLSAKKVENRIVRTLIKPGLWLQRITTNEPTADQLEVAIIALEAALGATESKICARTSPVY